jgi:predicted anti-sigma-YlaC factor YlaD
MGAPYSLEQYATVKSVSHISKEALEQYAMETLFGLEVKPVEEHLLTCSACREKLQEADEYVAAMRSAARKMAKAQEPQKQSAPTPPK